MLDPPSRNDQSGGRARHEPAAAKSELAATAPWDFDAAGLWEVARRAARQAGATDADADDVAQIVVERLLRTWDRPHLQLARQRGSASWRGYVAAAARNAWLDLNRSERRRRNRELNWSTADAQAPAPPRPGVLRRPTTSYRSDVDIDEYLARLEIVEVLGTLSGRQQLIAQYIFIEGWSVHEIAQALRISERTVRTDRAIVSQKIKGALKPLQDS